MSGIATFLSSTALFDLFQRHAAHGDVAFYLALGGWGDTSWDAFGFDAFPADKPLPLTLICDLTHATTTRAAVQRLMQRGATVLHKAGQTDGLWAHAIPEVPPMPGDRWGSWDFAFCGTLSQPALAQDGLPSFTLLDDPRAHRQILTQFDAAQNGGAQPVTPELLALCPDTGAGPRLQMVRLVPKNAAQDLFPISLQLWLDAGGVPVWKGVCFGCYGGLSDTAVVREPFLLSPNGEIDFGSATEDHWRDIKTTFASGRAFALGEYFTVYWPEEEAAIYTVQSVTAL